MKSIINDLANVHSAVTNHYACSRDPWDTFKVFVSDKLLSVLSRLRAMQNDNLLEACIQARAALPDAWAAVQCNVPEEVISLLNKAIANAENPPAGCEWNYHEHGEHAFFKKEDWRNDVTNQDTILGYQNWVEHNIESLLWNIDLESVDAIEVAGCSESDGHVDVTREGEEAADFFSVYTHVPEQGVECHCDFNTKPQAVEFARRLAARTSLPIYGNCCSIEEEKV